MKDYTPIPGYEGFYEISKEGEVRNVRTGRVLKPNVNTKGYHQVWLFNTTKKQYLGIHQLMAITFLGHVPNGNVTVIDHINSVKTDNRLENLQILPHRDNVSKGFLEKGTKSSNYTGVYKYNNGKNEGWVAKIRINRILIHLGYFHTQEEGAQAYQQALIDYNLI